MVLIFLIFLVFLIVIVATSEIRCSLAGSLRWLSALEFTSLWLGVLGRHYLSSALLRAALPAKSTRAVRANFACGANYATRTEVALKGAIFIMCVEARKSWLASICDLT